MGSGIKEVLLQAYRAKRIELDYFVFTGGPPGALAGVIGAQLPVNVQFNADSDFLWEAFNFQSYSAVGTPVPLPDYLIAFADTGSGRNLQDAPIHVVNVSGNGQLPYILPESRLFRATSICTVTVTNNTAIAAVVSFAMIGRKVFYNRGYNRDEVLAGWM